MTFGAEQAAWPLIRDELGLTYVQVGLLLTVPGLVSNLVEPLLGILADVWKRRILIVGGGLFFALAALMAALSHSFLPLMVAYVLFYPSSGAFVSLSQAALMDTDPSRHEHNMARWTLAGSLGVVIGPLALGAAAALGPGWRGMFVFCGLLALGLTIIARRFPFPNGATGGTQSFAPLHGLKDGLRGALGALRRREVLRWLILLGFSNLMLDVLLGFLALYFVDVVGASAAQAGLAVAVWSGLGLVGDFLIIPILERVRGLGYLRISAVIEMAVFAAFLLVPGLWIKLALVGLLGLFNAGWYAVLQGRLYSSMPGQSGTALAVANVTGLAWSLVPAALGALAGRFGLGLTMALLIAGPLALLVGLPRDGNDP